MNTYTKEVAFRSENSSSYEIQFLQIELSEKDKESILKAQKIVKENSFISSIRVSINSDIEYLNDEKKEILDSDFRVDTEFFIVYSNSFYYYAQNKWQSCDYFESSEMEIEEETDFLTDAMNKLTEELFNTIEPGEEKTLNGKYHLYRYLEDDIISIYETETEKEVIQVLTNGKGEFLFESLI
jgi:hypothetical protein